MSAYRPNHRDALTMRTARQVRDTISDPWSYSEGAAEPKYIVDDSASNVLAERVILALSAIGIPVLVILIVTGALS